MEHPRRPAVLKLMDEPRLQQSITEMLLTDPTVNMPIIDSPLPHLASERSDMLEPKLMKFRMLD
jgi:hypothetical protein